MGTNRRIGIAWPLSSFFGWGVLGINLALELLRSDLALPVALIPDRNNFVVNPLQRRLLRPVLEQGERIKKLLAQHQGKHIRFDFPIIHSVGTDLLAYPKGDTLHGSQDYAIVFIEDTRITASGRERGERYQVLVAGSRWNAELLRAAGFPAVLEWAQGVDLCVFHPAPRADLFPNRFVIFSGGKLEFRKAQDLVIAAFRRFHERHPDALLVTAWSSPYGQFARTLAWSKWIKAPPIMGADNRPDIGRWLSDEGIPEDAVVNLASVPNPMMAAILREADVALFPNRAEGGTNLAAMECLACGLPCILSANTGHLDIVESVPCYTLRDQGKVIFPNANIGMEGWGESSVEEMVAALEEVYDNREEARRRGLAAAEGMRDWTWEKQIRLLMGELQLT